MSGNKDNSIRGAGGCGQGGAVRRGDNSIRETGGAGDPFCHHNVWK